MKMLKIDSLVAPSCRLVIHHVTLIPPYFSCDSVQHHYVVKLYQITFVVNTLFLIGHLQTFHHERRHITARHGSPGTCEGSLPDTLPQVVLFKEGDARLFSSCMSHKQRLHVRLPTEMPAAVAVERAMSGLVEKPASSPDGQECYEPLSGPRGEN